MWTADSDQAVALTQSNPCLRLALLDGVCVLLVCICHFVGLAVYLLDDKHALKLSFSEHHLLNRKLLKEEV